MKHSLALVTNLYYPAKGREYSREDILLSKCLRKTFNVVLVHLEDLNAIADHVDAILIRNTGPKSDHNDVLNAIQDTKAWPVFNDLSGKGDMQGKQHLVDLFADGFPVIPTIDNIAELEKLGTTEQYLIKPLDGCDSHGLQMMSKAKLTECNPKGYVIQPLIKMAYEVSFYFIGDAFQYALYAPDPNCRWALTAYQPSDEDIAFAKQFVHWNACTRGIQRVDACRDHNGVLRLMELEDYNPYLSFELLEETIQEKFIQTLSHAIQHFIDGRDR